MVIKKEFAVLGENVRVQTQAFICLGLKSVDITNKTYLLASQLDFCDMCYMTLDLSYVIVFIPILISCCDLTSYNFLSIVVPNHMVLLVQMRSDCIIN